LGAAIADNNNNNNQKTRNQQPQTFGKHQSTYTTSFTSNNHSSDCSFIAVWHCNNCEVVDHLHFPARNTKAQLDKPCAQSGTGTHLLLFQDAEDPVKAASMLSENRTEAQND